MLDVHVQVRRQGVTCLDSIWTSNSKDEVVNDLINLGWDLHHGEIAFDDDEDDDND